MAYKVEIGEKNLVFSAPINDATKNWGVYCIPRMWRLPSGKLIIRINGEMDSPDPETRGMAPSLYYISKDNGKTFELDPNGYDIYDTHVIQGISSPYIRLSDGNFIALRNGENPEPVKGISPVKEFMYPTGGSYFGAFPAGLIPDECTKLEVIKYDKEENIILKSPVIIDFPEREIITETKVLEENGEYRGIPVHIKPMLWNNPYISCITELGDGSLCGLVGGQHPEVKDKYTGVIYLVVSEDQGKTWKMRSPVAMGKDEVPYGYGGDALETSLVVTDTGRIIVAMRMDVSIAPEKFSQFCETYIAISDDSGFTFQKPYPVAEASVTPQLVKFDGDIVALFYGRPGVHFKVSEDGGKTWSEDFRIIGKNYTESRALRIPDADIKYWDMESYSNIFVEKTSENSVLVCFNDMKYDEGDGELHRATLVREVKIYKEEV